MRKTLLLAASLTLSMSAHAEPMKWSGVSLSFDSIAFDDDLPDATGTVLQGAVSVDHFYVFGALGGYDVEDVPIEMRTSHIGAGGYADVTNTTAVFGEFGGWRQETEYTPTGYTIDSNGTSIGLGVRHQFAPRFEGQAGVSRTYDDGDASDTLAFGVRAYMTANVFFGAAFGNGERSTTTRLTVGAAF